MGSGAWTGAASGAASGAAMGASTGNPYVAAGGAIIGGIAGFFSGSNMDDQVDNQLAWSMYNAQQQYNVDVFNIDTSLLLAGFNANLIKQAAEWNAEAAMDASALNASIISATMMYNNALLDNELAQLWDAVDLDLTQLADARARERGDILATQAASGTVMDEGSNFDVIVDQKSQEAMDAFIIRHGADIAASDIANQKAQNLWQGDMAIKKTMWEGEMSSAMTMANAQAQVAGTLATAGISAMAGMKSAQSALASGMAGVSQAQATYDNQNIQNLTQGLFNAAGTATKAYYANKVPDAGGGKSVVTAGGAGSSLNTSSYTFNTGYEYDYGSLMGT